jgi:enoyl-CoA hydratase/carnithine racemase
VLPDRRLQPGQDGPRGRAALTDAAGAVAGDGALTSLTVAERVAHVVIERPEKRNAMSRAVLDGLLARAGEVAELVAADEVGAVVVAGRGGTFSAGLDLADLAGLTVGPLDEDDIARVQAVFTAFEELDAPVLAALDGVCLGAGLQLAIACHVRGVTPRASLAVLEPRWGLVPDLGASWRLPRLVGQGRATELMLTARRIEAEEALRIGLAEIPLEGEDALRAGHEVAVRWAAGPEVLRHLPRLVRAAAGPDRGRALVAEARLQLRMLAGGDVTEAIRAAVEGREPRYGGR